MLKIAGEVHLWKPDAVTELLREAHAAVVAAGVPDDLSGIAFREACGLLSQKQVQIEQIGFAANGVMLGGGRS